MKKAIIDMGSNSMRLTLYEIDGLSFKILFREKFMAGLAGYVENGYLSDEGIECAYCGLLNFREILEALEIKDISVFATASLRNIKNTEQAVTAIKVSTGYPVEIISGEEEALLGYTGAIKELDVSDGIFVDIGGASTEIVSFSDNTPLISKSFEIGSLNLFKKYVKKIIPGDDSQKKIIKNIRQVISDDDIKDYTKQSTLICVGGTARFILKMAKKLFGLSYDCSSISADKFYKICEMLCGRSKDAIDLILKLEPDRIHTIIPGILIMQHIFKTFDAKQMIVSKYGVREGYLCQRIMENTNTLKTEN